MNVLALILGGGMGSSLSVLSAQRAKPAIPFGGKYRIIDMVLSNIANSGLERVALLVQYQPESLIEHIKDGKPWKLKAGSPQVWQASLERTGHEAYVGTADAVYQNRRYIAEQDCELVLIVPGDHVYVQDYGDLIRFHQEKGAALTIATTPVPADEVQRFGILNVDESQKINWFIEKPGSAETHQASKGIYVFDTKFLLHYLEEDAQDPSSAHDFGRNVIPRMVETGQVYAYPFTRSWADIGSVEAYWKINLALLGDEPFLSLFDPSWPILTPGVQRPPTVIRPAGRIINSLVCEGCVIEGDVMHSILSPGVQVERGAVVQDAVVLHDTIIQAGAALRGCVIDKKVRIGAEAHIGAGGDLTPNQNEPKILNTGITVVGKGAHVPAGLVIGRNCRIDPRVGAEDFGASTLIQQGHLASGMSVSKKV